MLKSFLVGWAKRGGAVLYTSHLLDVADRVCDRVAVMASAKLWSVGPLEERRQTAGSNGTLERVFGALTESVDPEERAAALLGT